MARKKPRPAPTACPSCGSDELWSTYFDADENGTDGSNPADRYGTLCQACGTITY